MLAGAPGTARGEAGALPLPLPARQPPRGEPGLMGLLIFIVLMSGGSIAVRLVGALRQLEKPAGF